MSSLNNTSNVISFENPESVAVEPEVNTHPLRENAESMRSALIHAVTVNDRPQLDLLIARGESIDWAVAAMVNHKDLVFSLIDKGADRNYALRGAAMTNQEQLVALLISCGADYKFAVKGAIQCNNTKLLDDLIKREDCINDALEVAILNNKQELVSKLVKDGADKNFLLLRASSANDYELVKILIHSGTNMNYAVKGAVIGHHGQLVFDLIKVGASKDFAVAVSAVVNNRELVDQLLLEGASRSCALEGAVSGDHKNLLFDLINSCADLQQAIGFAETYGRLSLQDFLKTQQQRDIESAQLLVDFSHTVANQSTAQARMTEFEHSLAPAASQIIDNNKFFK